jgi:hypothetical protein
MIRRGMFTLFLTAVLLAAPRVALACPVCFGQSDSPLARATNLGILAMLGVVAVMLGSFGAFFVYLNKRARRFSADGSPAPVSRADVSATNSQEGIARC